jgi:hypothetical protein
MENGIRRRYWRGADHFEEEWWDGRWVLLWGPSVNYPTEHRHKKKC